MPSADDSLPAGRLPRAILIIEDEALILMLLQDMLEDAGCTVAGTCPTNAAALAAIPGGGFDAALVDLTLTDGSTEPVIEMLVAQSIPFAVMSGQPDDRFAESAAAFLAKPFTYEKLVETLEALASARRISG